jgi:hypothetical protein
MPQALMIVGALLSVLGVAGIAAGAPDWVLGLSLGVTLIQSGIIALVGGLALIGVALMLNAMRELLDRIDALTSGRRPAIEQRRRPATPSRPAARTPGDDATLIGEKPADSIDDAEVRNRRDPGAGYRIEETERAEREPPAEQAEGARTRREPQPGFASDDQMPVRREGKTRRDEEPAWRPRRETASETSNDDEPRSRPTSPAGRRDEVARSSRRNVLPMPPPPLPLPLDTRPRPREVTPDIPMPRFRPVETKPPEPAPAETTVVRSGVIGGMAYTLYADGSIEAELPIGTVRFGSIAELQDHVMRTGTEAEVDFKESGR